MRQPCFDKVSAKSRVTDNVSDTDLSTVYLNYQVAPFSERTSKFGFPVFVNIWSVDHEVQGGVCGPVRKQTHIIVPDGKNLAANFFPSSITSFPLRSFALVVFWNRLWLFSKMPHLECRCQAQKQTPENVTFCECWNLFWRGAYRLRFLSGLPRTPTVSGDRPPDLVDIAEKCSLCKKANGLENCQVLESG